MKFPFLFFKIKDRSMEPGIKENDFLLVSRAYGRLKEGDVIVLKHPTKGIYLVKRISKLGDGSYFVRGDNKKYSDDSRNFGPVAKNNVIGRVLLVI